MASVVIPWRARRSGRAGSTSPERVPMTRPSSGVIPMEVSTETPPSTALTEQPPPRWQVTRRSRATSAPRCSAALRVMYWWLGPWKP